MKTAMARHILVKKEADAALIKQRIKKGGDFAKLAKEHSTCSSAKRGGDLGEIRKGDLVKAVEKVIFSAPLKQVQGPVKSPFGYHIVEVYYRD